MNFDELNYSPKNLKRELTKYYISASEQDINKMLSSIDKESLESLYDHINDEVKFENFNLYESLEYGELVNHLKEISLKNNIKTSFIGDGLKNYKVEDIVPKVCSIRNLTTAYTPYQPERSQGTLKTLWIYQSLLSKLTGFEAINASLYERSTCLFEAINSARRIQKTGNTTIISEGIYPGDIEVLETLSKHTSLKIKKVPLNKNTGLTDIDYLKSILNEIKNDVSSICFPQMNNLGNLEDVNTLTDICTEYNCQSIAIIDPMLISNESLLPPSKYGTNSQGCDMIVAEGQHLAIGPNFGGPGLGIFGIRFNDKNKLSIRQTAGRYVGKAIDKDGKDCLAMVLSTREQHIRREKATSNICSNQSFVASIAGASLLAKGDKGITKSAITAKNNLNSFLDQVLKLEGVDLAFNSPFFNEVTLRVKKDVDELITNANSHGIHLGVNVSKRIESTNNLILISFFDIHTSDEIQKLINFFKSNFNKCEKQIKIPVIPKELKRTETLNIKNFGTEELFKYYTSLGEQNVSPDDNIYPLGSCTMKYNPYINDWAASLPGFTDIHPQAPLEDAQGSLEILYNIQEDFKKITGLPGVTTQPVAGAQGELVGIKMFQAYHKDNDEAQIRDIVLIPKSAHGTNPATATMAGFESKIINGQKVGIITLEANKDGQIDIEKLNETVTQYKGRISCVMVTNPNTSGFFEGNFKEMAEIIHNDGGLVYMDGANMNAIAGWIDLEKLGVDAVHNNLHKTWTIPHGGGGPGDAIVAVSEKLIDYLPGLQVRYENNLYSTFKPSKSIGSFHRHYGNFAHKVRAYTYLKALGTEGVKKMSAMAVLSARYLYNNLKSTYPNLPEGTENVPKMHEFIITLKNESFMHLQNAGTPKAKAMASIGKLYLDFGLHSPTVAFPEIYGLMIEPTESYTKAELDRFIDIVKAIHNLLHDAPEVLLTAPHFTPIKRVDEVYANKALILNESIDKLESVLTNKIETKELANLSISDICTKILDTHKAMS